MIIKIYHVKIHDINIFIHTLLDDRFPGDVGHWEHGIKYVAAGGTEMGRRKRLVSYYRHTRCYDAHRQLRREV